MGRVLALLKHLPTIIPLVIETVKLAEKLFGGGKGAIKREYVVNLVKLAIVSIEGFSQKDIADEAAFSEGVGDVVDGVVKILNSTKQFNKAAIEA